MFEAGFTYILSKSLMNTRTTYQYREWRRCVVLGAFFMPDFAFWVLLKNPTTH